jgi:hypothetical protein
MVEQVDVMSIYKPDFIHQGVVSAPDPVSDAPTIDKAIPPTTSFSEMTDQAFFMLGPIYEFVKLPFDLIAQFLADTKANVPVQAIGVNYVVLQGLKDWSNIIYAMPKSIAPLFIKWMVTQVYNNKSLGVVWQTRAREVDIADPGSIHIRKFLDTYVPVTLFLPYCNKVVIDAIENVEYSNFRITVNKPEGYNFPEFKI